MAKNPPTGDNHRVGAPLPHDVLQQSGHTLAQCPVGLQPVGQPSIVREVVERDVTRQRQQRIKHGKPAHAAIEHQHPRHGVNLSGKSAASIEINQIAEMNSLFLITIGLPGAFNIAVETTP